jgi:lactate permease
MFHQLLTPIAGNLGLSCATAFVPVLVVMVLMGVLRRPAWQASLWGLVAGVLLAVTVWRMPLPIALSSVAAGATFAVWPVMWIVFNALLLYNISVRAGLFSAFRDWMLEHLPRDKRIILIVIGFSFGSLLEGVAGSGAPIAITGALLVAMGFAPLDAIVYALIFNTAPVAFGALGSPITTLAAVTQIPDVTLGAMVGRQVPFIAPLLPFYVMIAYGGLKSVRALWPVLLVSGGSFAIAQFVCSNYLSYALTDVIAGLTSLILTIAFLKAWRPAPDPRFAPSHSPVAIAAADRPTRPLWQGWIPWVIVSVVVIAWMSLGINHIGEIQIHWPGLHNAVFITAYGAPYPAVWTFQPLATGTAILTASLVTALTMRIAPADLWAATAAAAKQARLPLATITLIVGLAYLLNYAGMSYTLGLGLASVGLLFPLLSPFLGWIAVFVSGSDTSGNALFGNLQVVAAKQIGLSPVLMAAANASGGVMGKMISPQNICIGTVAMGLDGREGQVLARTFKHSLVLTLALGGLVMLQQFVFPQIIPHQAASAAASRK